MNFSNNLLNALYNVHSKLLRIFDYYFMGLYIVLILFIRIIKLYNYDEQNNFSKWIQNNTKFSQDTIFVVYSLYKKF